MQFCMNFTSGEDGTRNPVKRGYVDEAIHWRYSSARDYKGVDGLLNIERVW
jgi:hypothetical protein